MQSENINELATALSKAQSEIGNALEDKANPHFRSKYASLASLWSACRTALTKNGLSVIQCPHVVADHVYLTTKLLHSSGQWIESTMPVLSAKTTPHAMGSALTYMRKYSLASMIGIAPGDQDDDDGNKAQGLDPEDSKDNVRFDFKSKKVPEPTQEQIHHFISTNHLVEDGDNPTSRYIAHVMKGKNMTFMEVIKSCSMNIDNYRSGFETWYKKNHPADEEQE